MNSNEVVARVFPRRTAATPTDELAFIGDPVMYLPEIDKVEISVAFSYDIDEAHRLAEAWRHVAPVCLGGPALGDPGGEFEPGKYLSEGYVITSRGCPNRCWFCDVHKREGDIRELKIKQGWNLLDSNILACSRQHIIDVFKMLSAQPHKVELTGGLETAKLEWWHIELLWNLKPNQIFFAYDSVADLEPLIEAGKKLRYANFTRRHLRCFVLIGYAKDTMEGAYTRLIQAWEAGFMPMAMLYRDRGGVTNKDWEAFQRDWARPSITKRVIEKTLKQKVKLDQ